jgi:hypothetical protein
MSFDSISFGNACTLPTSGTDPDCLGSIGSNSSLILSAGDIQVTTGGNCFDPTLLSASIEGTIFSLPVGSSIDLQNIDQIYANMNVNLWNIGDDVLFDIGAAKAELTGGELFIAPNGAVYDNFGLNIDGTTQEIFDDLRSALFGTGANADTVTFAFQPGFLLLPDAIVTANENINPCFTRGTRILTINGEIAVEDLKIGDIVVNANGDEREIIWIGHRDIDIARHPNPKAVLPVIIEAGALGENCPSRRLTLSPDHALFIDGVLVQPKDLLNGVSIRQTTAAVKLRYYHVELECHDILFAEGAAVESYLDTGHRGVFDNADAPVVLHPELMQMRREAEGCAPLCTSGENLERIRTRLAHGVGHAHAALAYA